MNLVDLFHCEPNYLLFHSEPNYILFYCEPSYTCFTVSPVKLFHIFCYQIIDHPSNNIDNFESECSYPTLFPSWNQRRESEIQKNFYLIFCVEANRDRKLVTVETSISLWRHSFLVSRHLFSKAFHKNVTFLCSFSIAVKIKQTAHLFKQRFLRN